MKLFLKKLTKFLLLPTVAILLVFLVKNNLAKRIGQFSIPKEKVNLVIGSSLGECALNDKILPATKNLAQSGEAYFYTYKKLEYLLEKNDHIEKIFLSISNGSIHKTQDNWIWGEAYLIDKFTKCSFLMGLEDFTLLAKHNLGGLIKSIPIAMLRDIYVMVSHKNYIATWGSFLALDHEYTPTSNNTKTNKEKNDNLSDLELNYLKKIIGLASSKGIEIYLVRTPMYKGQTVLLNEKRFMDVINEELKGIIFLDHLNYKAELSDFADRSHLNGNGAEKYSKFFTQEVFH